MFGWLPAAGRSMVGDIFSPAPHKPHNYLFARFKWSEAKLTSSLNIPV